MDRNKIIILLLSILVYVETLHAQTSDAFWPEISKEAKTWTRWWWMGSAVNKKNITQSLIAFEKAGLGGVEIEPIYGVKGHEKEFINYLSPEWLAMLEHTLSVADSLDMGVDFTLGTGWPWGGATVSTSQAAKRLLVRKIQLKKGRAFSDVISPYTTGQLVIPSARDIRKIDSGTDAPKLIGVFAFNIKNDLIELTSLIKEDQLDWKAENDDFSLYFVFEDLTGQKVKRAAPGGAGWVLDHFSPIALNNYLNHFGQAFENINGKVRSVFNDSYEVYKADYTPDFFDIFKKQRGYDLLPYINLLLDEKDLEISNRIRSDYRETLSDILVEKFNPEWNQWADKFDVKTKYQAHGSPGNLIDLYAAADIPECETFGSMPYDIAGFRRIEGNGSSPAYPNRNFRAGDADPAMIKFSSSAAHLTGKPLVSAETFTWLREHFRAALSQCKPEVEDLFINGINHVFLHGSTYSPVSAPWPGWKFYASVNFNPTNPIWEDAPSLFEYISRTQSILQSGNPDNDVLVYWPVHDSWTKFNGGKTLVQFAIHRLETWLSGTPFYETAHYLLKEGYGFDYISDRLLEKINVENGVIKLPGGNYRSIVVPASTYMPLKTIKKLVALRELGASVVFLGVPKSVPGFYDFKIREKELSAFVENKINKVYDLKEMEIALKKSGAIKENLVKTGLKYIRKEDRGEKIYYVVNHSPNTIEGFLPIGVSTPEVLIMNPLDGRVGKAITQQAEDHTQVKLSLPSGGSLILKTFKRLNAPRWQYLRAAEKEYKISGIWDFELLKGGPDTDYSKKVKKLGSWTDWSEQTECFSGTAAYKIKFERPSNHQGPWLLDLGDLRESAKVWLNNKYVGTVWANPYNIVLKELKKGKNTLRLEVTNLGSNRIKAKEARGEEWKNFYEINMVSLDYQPFDASRLDVLKSGLLEDPILIPLENSP